MAYYSMALNVEDQRCVVVGGGAVAQRRVEELLVAGAQVVVIAPQATDALRQLATDGRLEWRARAAEAQDLVGATLVIAATDDRGTNATIGEAAHAHGALVNVVDDPAHCDFITPALVRRGDVTIAISTGGNSPSLAGLLRRRLEGIIGPEYGLLASVLGSMRERVMAELPNPAQRAAFWQTLVNSDLVDWLRPSHKDAAEQVQQARTRVEELLAEFAATSPTVPGSAPTTVDLSPAPIREQQMGKKGFCYLVGAGPGDPGLITLRGIECVSRADVVIYDRLVDLRLLDYAPSTAERIYVGKATGHHAMQQETINALLLERARQGKTVVRLKGGDPFVLGRGGEEVLALAQAGIPFEVVPGITSAIAAPAYAGIPVTHRDLAASFAVVTGHRRDGAEDGTPEMLNLPEADTLVVLMGLTNLPAIIEHLLARGASPETPAALIHRATTPQQKTVMGTLANIVEVAQAEGMKPPVTLVVGKVVALREQLRWFDEEDQP